ncbi:hypothetical protein PFISCL1PPCAC_23770 [Pristionchus fissidentatus]|uniref:Headcase N-terminal domain-containing protein n=1 Tax=Pristionchus fissidentatus TaxID=1538716 RepID=A0AAV5WQD4_9BILA|nr:hypothetical protein PFISCL1PPCAC_23770 [Pristionchus fissidentatus]
MGKDKYKKPEQMRPKKGAKEEETVAVVKGCHASIDVSGCIRPKDPVPAANSIDGVKMSCSSHTCPFANKFSVHKECFKRLTEKIVGMLERTGSSSWTAEQRVENVWRKKGLTFVGKFITCPCGHGKQCLEDSENRWSRLGEVVLDANAYEAQREEKIKRALTKQEKAALHPVTHTLGKSLNCTFGGKSQAELARKLEWEERAMDGGMYRRNGSGDAPAPVKKPKTSPAVVASFPSPSSIDDDGFTTVGKDGRARETYEKPSAAAAAHDASRKDASKGAAPLRSIVSSANSFMSPTATANQAAAPRGTRGRTVSSSSTTSWNTATSTPRTGGGGGREKTRRDRRGKGGGGGKENRRKTGYQMLSGSEEEEEMAMMSETPGLQSTMRNLREFVDEFHSYSGIGLWSASEVKELNEHLALFQSDSALFQCRITGRTLREPTILTQLNPVSAWFFTTQAMAMQKPDIPPGTQITLQEYYAIFHDYEVEHLEDPIVMCKDGTIAVLDCVDMTMLTMGK